MGFVRLSLVFCLALTLSATCGCKQQKLPPGMPPLYPIHITVMQDGKPLPDAIVSIAPTQGDSKWGAVATTDKTGVAKVFYTAGQYEGVVAGKYKATVRKVEKEREKIDIPPEPKDPQEKYAWRMKYIENQPAPKEYELVDQKFMDFRTTPLEFEVQAAKKGNDFTLDVEKGVRILFKR